MNVNELCQQRAGLVKDARALLDKADEEKRAVTAEEKQKYDELLGNAKTLSEDIARREALETLEQTVGANGVRNGALLSHEDRNNTRNGKHSYSLMKAMRQQLGAREGRDRLDGIELEVHTDLAKRSFRPAQGVLVPWTLGGERRGALWQADAEKRALDTTAGTGSIPTILSTSLIDLLRNRMVVQAAGATVMADMQGLFAIPRQNAAGTMYWVNEAGAPTASNQTIDQVAFSPKTAGAFTDYTRRFLEQTNQDAEAFVRNDLMAIVARGVDLAALSGSGSSNQPTGIANISGISTIAQGTNGGDPTWALIVGLESKVAIANADMGALGYIVNAATRGKMKQTPKIGSTFPVYLWDVNSGATPLNGYPTYVSNQVRSNLTKGTSSGVCSEMFFGNWADLVLAFWSGLDILVDPYTGSSTGNVRIVCLQDVDINVRHKESFSYCADMTTV